MKLVFDTSVIIDLEKRNADTIEKLKEIIHLYPEKPAIAFISYFEFLYGLRKKDVRNKEKAIAFIEEFPIIQTTKTTAGILVWLKEKYELPLADLLIASQAIENQSVLVTKDNDFDKIKELNKIIV